MNHASAHINSESTSAIITEYNEQITHFQATHILKTFTKDTCLQMRKLQIIYLWFECGKIHIKNQTIYVDDYVCHFLIVSAL